MASILDYFSEFAGGVDWERGEEGGMSCVHEGGRWNGRGVREGEREGVAKSELEKKDKSRKEREVEERGRENLKCSIVWRNR